MNILHTEASTGWGGQDIRVLLEAREMGRRGHRVVLACAPGCPLWEAAQKDGVCLEPVVFGHKLKLGTALAVRRIIRRHGSEIVNTHSSADGWSGAVGARLAGRPCVRTRHLSNPVKRTLTHRLLYTKLTDFVVTTGEALRQTLITHNGLDPARVTSIPTGIDIAHFDPARWERAPFRQEIGAGEDEFLWVMVAMIRRMKGHEVLAEAAVQLAKDKPNVRFVLVGDGGRRAEVEKRLRDLHIADRCTLLGYRDDVAHILAGCNAAVLSSVGSEGVPQSLMQALAMAKPVVSTNVGGIPEIVRDGQTGSLVPPGDATALAAAMRRVMDDPATAATLARRGQELIRAQYSVAVMLDKMEQVYRQVVT